MAKTQRYRFSDPVVFYIASCSLSAFHRVPRDCCGLRIATCSSYRHTERKNLGEALCVSIVFVITVSGLAATYGNAFGSYLRQSSLNQSFTKPMLNELSNPALHGSVLTSYDYGAELV